jgi:enterobactin synthetase component D
VARCEFVAIDLAFELTLEHGLCVGVRIPSADADLDRLVAHLAPEEQAKAASLPRPRRRTWAGGRAAMRQALARLGRGLDAATDAVSGIGTDDRGAPVMPPGVVGSITHKEDLAAALVASTMTEGARVGVDLEMDVVRPLDIARRVLTAGELEEIASLDAGERAREVLLRFSAKEAVYKALDPYVRRYVGFLEVEVSPAEDGGAVVRARLRDGEGPFAIEVRWRRFDGVVLTTARVERR